MRGLAIIAILVAFTAMSTLDHADAQQTVVRHGTSTRIVVHPPKPGWRTKVIREYPTIRVHQPHPQPQRK